VPVHGRVSSLESTGTDHSECVERESIRGELQWVGIIGTKPLKPRTPWRLTTCLTTFCSSPIRTKTLFLRQLQNIILFK